MIDFEESFSRAFDAFVEAGPEWQLTDADKEDLRLRFVSFMEALRGGWEAVICEAAIREVVEVHEAFIAKLAKNPDILGQLIADNPEIWKEEGNE